MNTNWSKLILVILRLRSEYQYQLEIGLDKFHSRGSDDSSGENVPFRSFIVALRRYIPARIILNMPSLPDYVS